MKGIDWEIKNCVFGIKFLELFRILISFISILKPKFSLNFKFTKMI